MDVTIEELETLRQQNQTLKEQVKLLVKTERRLDKSQKELNRQLKGIHAMSAFALSAGATSDLNDITTLSLRTLFDLFAMDQAVGFLLDADGQLTPHAIHAAEGLEGDSAARLIASTWSLPVAELTIPTEPVVFKTADKALQSPGLVPCLACMEALYVGAVEESDGPDYSISVVIPLQRKGGALLGLLAIRKLDPASKSFHEELPTKKDVGFLQNFGNSLESALDNAMLQAERQKAREDQQRMARELEIATQIQQSMLPTKPPAIPGMDIAFHFKPADEVGGDYYDLLPMGDTHLAVAVGDVNGHGLGAALLMAMAKSSLHTQVGQNADITAVMTGLNDMIYNATTERRFMTFIYAVIDLNTWTMISANAGHPHPYLMSGPDGDVSAVESPAVYPLGVRKKGKYALHESHLSFGDVLVFYSDGIIEGRNPVGEEFGFDRFEQVIHDRQGASAAGVRDGLLQAFTDFEGIQDDDITLLVLKFAPVIPVEIVAA
ncbi:MAG: PP2C family protein-serine/threonine phosphatase [Candidatus Sericytochromatia bacterium]|nr:PP2C family protein-serine/threonine phosphatase [Candidatus Sericytochromatia bacterium]